MIKIKLDFSPIVRVVNTLYKDLSIITVNGGGGMGGSQEEIICSIINRKTIDGYMLVREIITNEMVEINPLYVGTIRKVNLTKVYFEHRNPNFPSGKRTYWFTHSTDTEIEFTKDENNISIENSKKSSFLNLKHIKTDNMINL